jgi:hypothetical protein
MSNLSKMESQFEYDAQIISEIAREGGIFLSRQNVEYVYDIVSRVKKGESWVNDLSRKEILDLIIQYIV